MPKFDVPKMIQSIRLCEYAPEFEDTTIKVWVNPPAKMINEYTVIRNPVAGLVEKAKTATDEDAAQLAKELIEISAKVVAWYAQIWIDWSVEDVQTLADHSRDTDPMLWPWLTRKTQELIFDHRTEIKKG